MNICLRYCKQKIHKLSCASIQPTVNWFSEYVYLNDSAANSECKARRLWKWSQIYYSIGRWLVCGITKGKSSPFIKEQQNLFHINENKTFITMFDSARNVQKAKITKCILETMATCLDDKCWLVVVLCMCSNKFINFSRIGKYGKRCSV